MLVLGPTMILIIMKFHSEFSIETFLTLVFKLNALK